MKLIDFITRVFFGNFTSEGFFKEDAQKAKDSYALSSIFPSTDIEKKALNL